MKTLALLSIPMKHDPLGNSHNGFLRLIEGRELRLYGIIGVRHVDHECASYVQFPQLPCCADVLPIPCVGFS
jgi:hypothetical protein